jgi:hypothetical protein
MSVDYRYDPFTNSAQSVQITNELQVVPSNSPYTIRLVEVPKKDTPSSIVLKIRDTLAAAITTTGATTCTVAHGAWFANGDVITIDSEQMLITGIASNVLTVTRGYNSTVATTHLINAVVYGPALEEVSAAPAVRQYWPDYTTGADGDDDWNTGTLLFNAAHAGMTVVANYNGMGTLVDSRYDDAHLLATNGYQKLSNGLIVQWGSVSVPGNTTAQSVTLPIAFPNAGLNAWASYQPPGNNGVCGAKIASKTTITVMNSSDPAAAIVGWLAIGN